MSGSKITFFQFKTRLQNPNYPTSPNVWRVRLALNYKSLPYKTVWVDGPDIAQTCISEGIPNLDFFEDGSPHYTLPALIDATHPDAPVKLVDSRKIVDYLEETYPEEDPQRALYPPRTKAFQALAHIFVRQSVMVHFRPLAVVGAANLQTDRTRSTYLVRHRASYEKAQSMDEAGRANVWEAALAALDVLDACIKENGDSEWAPYFAGRRITFTDLDIAAYLIYVKLSLGEEEFGRVRAHNGGRWGRLLDSFAEYM